MKTGKTLLKHFYFLLLTAGAVNNSCHISKFFPTKQTNKQLQCIYPFNACLLTTHSSAPCKKQPVLIFTVVQSFSNCAALSKSWLQVRIYKVRNDSLNCNTRKHNLNSVLEYSHIPARQEIFPETKTKEFERGFYCINWKY